MKDSMNSTEFPGFETMGPSDDFTNKVMAKIETHKQVSASTSFRGIPIFVELGVLMALVVMCVVVFYSSDQWVIAEVFNSAIGALESMPIISSPLFAISAIGVLLLLTLERILTSIVQLKA